MPIELDHTIVPSHDRVRAAEFFSRIFEFERENDFHHFAPVRVNGSLTLFFADHKEFESHHYAFKVSDQEFDEILARIEAEELPYGSTPFEHENMQIYRNGKQRGVYFCDPNEHLLEILTPE